jgi:hypothetical protein
MLQKTETVEHKSDRRVEKLARLASEVQQGRTLLCTECREEIEAGQEVAFKRERTAEAETFYCHRKCFEAILAKTF